jgi:hypothetical protein
MPVETPVDFISDLDKTSPNGSEKISDGDNHIRNIKKAITETFPNIDGEVTVGQDKLNELDVNLPAAPTVEGSVLHNSGGVWTESNILEIKNGGAYIPAFSGLGNLTLYVDNDGQIQSAEMADNPSLQHDVESHTDVSYASDPVEDDILVFNGSEWVNTPNRTGNMFKPCNQNRSVGGGFVYKAATGWESSTKSGDYYVFTVPGGVRFALVSIKSTGSNLSAGASPSLKVDNIETNSLARYQKEWPSWVEMGDAGPMTEVKDKIEVNWDGAEGSIVINGYFFEV